MRKVIIALLATLAVALVGTASAEARPYLHVAEARCALQGCYGSDNDVEAIRVKYGYRYFAGWLDTIRYNGYDVCMYASYVTAGGLYIEEPFEAYYPHSYDDGPEDIWDAYRPWKCPQFGATQ